MTERRNRSTQSVLFLFLIMTLAISLRTSLQAVEYADAHSGITFSAGTSTSPVIDGIIEEDEWKDAHREMFTMKTEPQGAVVGVFEIDLAVMNDPSNLYLLVKIDRPQGMTGIAAVAFWFDNTHKGYRAEGDDFLQFDSTVAQGLYDGSWSVPVNSNLPDINLAGTNDGMARISFDGSVQIIEMSHPICSGDNRDFCLTGQAGEVLGFMMSLSADSSPAVLWPSPGMADIQIVSAATNTRPIANAGISQSVDEGKKVTLDASGSSDADTGSFLTFSWTQISGPSVMFSDPSSPNRHFQRL